MPALVVQWSHTIHCIAHSAVIAAGFTLLLVIGTAWPLRAPARRRGKAMSGHAPAYGLWLLVIMNTAWFLMFAFSFTRPQTARNSCFWAAKNSASNANAAVLGIMERQRLKLWTNHAYGELEKVGP